MVAERRQVSEYALEDLFIPGFCFCRSSEIGCLENPNSEQRIANSPE